MTYSSSLPILFYTFLLPFFPTLYSSACSPSAPFAFLALPHFVLTESPTFFCVCVRLSYCLCTAFGLQTHVCVCIYVHRMLVRAGCVRVLILCVLYVRVCVPVCVLLLFTGCIRGHIFHEGVLLSSLFHI